MKRKWPKISEKTDDIHPKRQKTKDEAHDKKRLKETIIPNNFTNQQDVWLFHIFSYLHPCQVLLARRINKTIDSVVMDFYIPWFNQTGKTLALCCGTKESERNLSIGEVKWEKNAVHLLKSYPQIRHVKIKRSSDCISDETYNRTEVLFSPSRVSVEINSLYSKPVFYYLGNQFGLHCAWQLEQLRIDTASHYCINSLAKFMKENVSAFPRLCEIMLPYPSDSRSSEGDYLSDKEAYTMLDHVRIISEFVEAFQKQIKRTNFVIARRLSRWLNQGFYHGSGHHLILGENYQKALKMLSGCALSHLHLHVERDCIIALGILIYMYESSGQIPRSIECNYSITRLEYTQNTDTHLLLTGSGWKPALIKFLADRGLRELSVFLDNIFIMDKYNDPTRAYWNSPSEIYSPYPSAAEVMALFRNIPSLETFQFEGHTAKPISVPDISSRVTVLSDVVSLSGNKLEVKYFYNDDKTGAEHVMPQYKGVQSLCSHLYVDNGVLRSRAKRIPSASAFRIVVNKISS